MKIQRIATMFLLCACFVPASSALAQPEDDPTPFVSLTPLTLINGWINAPFGTSDAEVEKINGIVHFKGAIATDRTDAEPFVLPDEFRPAHNVYLPVDMCNATNGRLIIQPNGVVTVQAETSFSNAACFTSLDGASFATSSAGFTPLKLIDNWTNAPYGTSNAEVANIGGIVHFKGAVSGGEFDTPFTLPKQFRPSGIWTYTPADLCNAQHGMLVFSGKNENVYILVNTSTYASAQCFTSLDGAWYARSDTGFTPLTLINGWTCCIDGTKNAAVAKIDGIVYFEGGIGNGTDAVAFVLPKEFRPVTNVYVSVALQCDSYANKIPGRLYIQPNGVVTIQETGFRIAQCWTSLDGASFVEATTN
jgi:hypothetical protein